MRPNKLCQFYRLYCISFKGYVLTKKTSVIFKNLLTWLSIIFQKKKGNFEQVGGKNERPMKKSNSCQCGHWNQFCRSSDRIRWQCSYFACRGLWENIQKNQKKRHNQIRFTFNTGCVCEIFFLLGLSYSKNCSILEWREIINEAGSIISRATLTSSAGEDTWSIYKHVQGIPRISQTFRLSSDSSEVVGKQINFISKNVQVGEWGSSITWRIALFSFVHVD